MNLSKMRIFKFMKPRISPLWIAIFAIVLWVSSCNDKDVPEAGGFLDYGFIPASVSAGPDVAEFQSLVYNKGYVFVATSDGIWKNDLANAKWSRAGLKGKTVTAIYRHPEVENRLFAGVGSDGHTSSKTLFISDNNGKDWRAATHPIYDQQEKRYESYLCFAARPGFPDQIYANLEGGTTIAFSADGGNTWTRMNNMEYSYFGYQSVIAFLPNDPNTIYQGSEAPLDFAWLASYEINPDNPIMLGSYSTIVNHEIWGNRRPNQLKAFAHSPGTLYVGQEGALSKVVGNTSEFIFKKEDYESLYTYMYGIWVNPSNPFHILFGGGLNHDEQPMQLYETFDEGETIHRFSKKFGLENPVVVDIVHTDEYPAILLNDQGADKVKLVVYKNWLP